MRSLGIRFRRRLGGFVVGLACVACLSVGQEGERPQEGESGPGQGGPPQGPPALVVVDQITSGVLAPTAEFVGTVYYKEISEVAGEVDGRVEQVCFEEGQRVAKGEKLVHLDDELLRKQYQVAKAQHEEMLTEIEKAKIDLERAETLYREGSGTEEEYDDARFALRSLQSRERGLQAALNRIESELEKKTVSAPFNGIVVDKHVEVGEWVSEGDTVATVAGTETMDILVDVPGRYLPYIERGMEVLGRVGGQVIEGKVVTVLPRGDVASRTFAVKIRIPNETGLMEGMEARVSLPIGEEQTALLVPRDAVLPQGPNQVIYTVEGSTQTQRVVEVVGYKGLEVGIRGEGLESGMQVVTKGNERLRPGQPVQVIQPSL